MMVPQRILLLQHHFLGDVLLTTPAIRAARAAFPHARIDFATNPVGAQALWGNPHLNNLLVDPGWWAINRIRYDAVVDFHSVPRTARVVAASRAPLRVGLRGRGPRNLAYTQLLPREREAVYMPLQKLRMLAPLGVDPASADLALEVAVTVRDEECADDIFERLRLDGSRVIAVSPVAKHTFKQWGAHNWARVADVLAQAGARILITYGPGEQAQAESMAKAMTQPAQLQDTATTIQQLAAVYARCALWVGNDGGPKHIAVAAGIPTVAVYRRKLSGVWTDSRSGSRQIGIDSGSDDLTTITPDSVVAAARRLL